MNYELISDYEYENLPADNDRCFIEFESICRRNMTRMIDNNSTRDFDYNVRQQYITAVSAVASECGVPDIVYEPDRDSSFDVDFANFCLAVQGAVARIRIRQRGENHPYSVLLTENTRTKIDHYISRVRELIKNSDMDYDKKKRLEQKLDELASALGEQRLSFAKTMAILVAVTTTVAGVTTIAADGKNAIAHIMQLIGQDKESEEHASKRLAPAPKAIPAPTSKSVSARGQKPTRASYELDDDIPF